MDKINHQVFLSDLDELPIGELEDYFGDMKMIDWIKNILDD